MVWEEYVILDTLVCYPHLDILLIAQKLFFEPKQAQKIFASLERKRLIIPVEDDKNKIRTRYYSLSAEGEKCYREMSMQRDEVIHMLLKFMTRDELERFMKTLVKIGKIFISNTGREEDFIN